MTEHATPFDLIASIRRERGSEVGPPPVGYQQNRSLESRDGEGPPLDLEPRVADLVGTQTPPPRTITLPPPPPSLMDDTINLMAKAGSLGGHRFTLTEGELKAIKQVVIRAIRRELRELEK